MTAQILLELDEGDNVPPSMRQEVLRHQWELASRDSYPWVRVVDDDEEIRPGEPEELERMQALASAVADLCERVPKLRQKYEKELEISHTCTVPLSDGRSADFVLTLNTELEFTEEDEPAGLDAFFSSAEAEALGRRPRYAELVA